MQRGDEFLDDKACRQKYSYGRIVTAPRSMECFLEVCLFCCCCFRSMGNLANIIYIFHKYFKVSEHEEAMASGLVACARDPNT